MRKWHARPPPPLHGKIHLKFPFWLFEPLPISAIELITGGIWALTLTDHEIYICTGAWFERFWDILWHHLHPERLVSFKERAERGWKSCARSLSWKSEWNKPLHISYLQALDLPKYLVPFPRMGHLKISRGPTQIFKRKMKEPTKSTVLRSILPEEYQLHCHLSHAKEILSAKPLSWSYCSYGMEYEWTQENTWYCKNRSTRHSTTQPQTGFVQSYSQMLQIRILWWLKIRRWKE